MADTLFFCGIGGSGMSALAMIMQKKGFQIEGSDRSYDQGQTPEKFEALKKSGITLFPQDGSGIRAGLAALVVSAAVEKTIPDVKAAQEQSVPVRTRAEVLAEVFNDSPLGVSVAGTSGKSTVTGMIAHIFALGGLDPAVMNGGVMLNFLGESQEGLGNMRAGRGGVFVAETDESDGSIALYNPAVAVLNNIALDHKSLEELDTLFGDFIARATTAAVINKDDTRVVNLASRATAPVMNFSVYDSTADFYAAEIKTMPDGVSFVVMHEAHNYPIRLKVPGIHNVSNAMAALAVAKVFGVGVNDAINSLESFKGIRRRLEVVGTQSDITVLDDFAHNPDKIRASLKTLREFPGRLIVMFQPHGFGPLKLMGREIADVFSSGMDPSDILLVPEAFYAGGTVDRSVTAEHLVQWVRQSGRDARWFSKREDILPVILELVRPGDRVVIMGARDDTLSVFAQNIMTAL